MHKNSRRIFSCCSARLSCSSFCCGNLVLLWCALFANWNSFFYVFSLSVMSSMMFSLSQQSQNEKFHVRFQLSMKLQHFLADEKKNLLSRRRTRIVHKFHIFAGINWWANRIQLDRSSQTCRIFCGHFYICHRFFSLFYFVGEICRERKIFFPSNSERTNIAKFHCELLES